MKNKMWVWVDLERTGDDINIDKIIRLEISLTDRQLSNLVEGPRIVIDEQAADQFVPLEEASMILHQFLSDHSVTGGVLCGNNIQLDTIFLQRLMPALFERTIDPTNVIDISTFQELGKIWHNMEPPSFDCPSRTPVSYTHLTLPTNREV